MVGLVSIDGQLVRSHIAGSRKEICALNPLQRLRDSLKGPDRCSLGVASKAKCHCFDSQSGYIEGVGQAPVEGA